ncbi:PAS domain S-box protein [Pseudodesulfovibrio aespoeensis]|uniref:PAS domain S-box protein n=1 Tax=Pseudodesulfovibrio aespoeensis TaxID=182210 RepID=UPI002355F167|nr:PAS domain S-box protein [Pseudodesulfovibrio aespoeensis]MCG2733981.1 PAS domain S-box protein [Pseudodesulfovibrio aespoeensis]
MGRKGTKSEAANHGRATDPAAHGPAGPYFDLVPLPCHCLDDQGRIVAVNRAWLALLGFSREEATGRPLDDFLAGPPQVWAADGSSPESPVCLTMLGRDGCAVEVRAEIRRPDGAGAGFSLAHFLYPQGEADARTVAGDARIHRLVAENTEDVVWTVDNDLRYTYVSPSVGRLRGIVPEDVVGRCVDQFVTPQTLPLVLEALDGVRRAVARGERSPLARMELEVQHADGSAVWVEAVARPLLDHAGACVGFIGSTRSIGDRREVEQRLRRNERALRALLDATVEDVGLYGTDGTISIINGNMAARLDLDPEEAAGLSLFDHLPQERVESWRESFRQVAQTGRPVSRKGHLKGRHFDLTLYPVFGQDGEVDGVAIFAKDTTERTRAEEALRESEARYRRMLETANEGILSMDADGRIAFANQTMVDFMGHDFEDIIGATLPDLMPPDEHSEYVRRAQAIKSGGVRYEQRFVRRDGTRTWGRVSATPIRTDVGEYAGAFVMIADITEAKMVERSLCESEARYRRIVETANEGIISIGPNGNIRFANKVLCRMLGYAVYELLGKPVSALLYPEDIPRLEEHLVRRRQGLSDQFEQRYRCKDGSSVWALVSASPILGDDGRYQGVLAMAADISGRKRAEAELVRSERNYRNLFENSVEGLYQSTPQGRFVSVNPALVRLTGYDSPQEFMDAITDITTQFYYDPKDRDRLVQALIQHGEVRQFEILIRRKGGGTLWVSINSRLSRGLGNEPELFEGSIIDITGRKRVEEALRLTQFSVDMAPVSIYWIDRSGRYVYVNDHGCSSLGYGQDDLLAMTVSDICPLFSPDTWAEYWNARRLEDIRRFETVHRCRDGRELPVEIVSHYKVYGGKEYLFVYAYDLTERHQAEQALRWSRELLNEVQRISLTGGWEHDLDTGANHWTDGQFRLFGLEPDGSAPDIGHILNRHIHSGDTPRLVEAWTSLLRDMRPVEVEFRCLRDDGSQGVLVGVAIPETDGRGRLRRVFGSTRDVTQERQAARELAQSHERLLTILDGIDANIYVSELDSHEVLFMNAHIQETYGTSGQDSLCHEILRGESRQCQVCPKPALLNGRGAPVGTLVREWHSQITGRWYLNHDRAIEWLEGRLVHMHMATDITDLKVMEQELKRAMAKAEAASLAKNEFLANMSHEIRTPLNGLLGMLQLLQLTILGGEQREFLEIALSSGRSLLQILNDILDISKIESGKLELDDQELDLGEVAESVVAVFRHQARMRGIEVALVMDKTLPRHFLADKVRLRQILFNLVGNATKFTESGSVLVEAYPLAHPMPDGRAQLFFSVSDTGIGIPDDKMDQIFDPFTQVDGSFTRKYQGTGLGLGIVRRLVALMGGTIAVDSELGAGTTVVFTVAARRVDHAAFTPAVSGQNGVFRPLSILVVEDERTNRAVAQRLLGKLGHEAACAESGEEAIEILATAAFDCILMDIQMPGLDGVETTRAIRDTLGLDIPIIALTAHAMEGDRKRFLDAGMQGYVAKPFDLPELQDELERVLLESGR